MTKLSIKDIKPNPNNPRIIKDDKFKKLVQSIKDFPEMADVREIVINKDNVILGGNMRFKAMKEAGWKEVPVRVVDWDEEKQRQFIIKDNVSGGEWDWDALANQWDSAELDDWGLDLPDSFGDDKEVIEDEAPEIDNSEPPKSKLGEIYQLGRHRVMCGDSTDAGNVALLMNGVKADMVFTDPPYRMEAQGGSNQPIGRAAAKLGESIKDLCDFDPVAFLNTIPTVFSKGIMNAYIFCNKDLVPDYLAWAKDTGYNFNILFWKKPNAIPLGGNHRPDVEYLLLFRKSAIWNNAVSGVSYSKCLEFGRESSTPHPTMKPIELITNELQISSNKDGVVMDFFLGSGSTLIACEQTNRICYGMELDPKYVDVIRKRYWKFVNGTEEGWQDGTKAI